MMTKVKVCTSLHLELFLKCITRYMADKSDLDYGDSAFQAAGQVIMSTVHACVYCVYTCSLHTVMNKRFFTIMLIHV